MGRDVDPILRSQISACSLPGQGPQAGIEREREALSTRGGMCCRSYACAFFNPPAGLNPWLAWSSNVTRSVQEIQSKGLPLPQLLFFLGEVGGGRRITLSLYQRHGLTVFRLPVSLSKRNVFGMHTEADALIPVHFIKNGRDNPPSAGS